MRFKIEIVVNYDEASIDLTPEEMEHRLEVELDRHVQDGLLLYNYVIDQYSAEVSHVKES